MEAKEILQKYYKTYRQVRLLKLKADGMRKSLYGKGSSGVQNSSPGSSDGMGVGIAMVIDYEKKADELSKELESIRNEAEKLIESVQDIKEKEILVRRYLLFQTWNKIAVSMNYSKAYVFELHRKALKSINNIVNHSKS